jgi:predicted amidohydrolase YtcJ
MPIQRRAADVIITNAFVRTLDPQDSAVQAVVVSGDRIMAWEHTPSSSP